jgi:hypothetical protein
MDFGISAKCVGGDGAFWGAQAAGLLVSAASPKQSLKVRDGGPPSPAREPRALPRISGAAHCETPSAVIQCRYSITGARVYETKARRG